MDASTNGHNGADDHDSGYEGEDAAPTGWRWWAPRALGAVAFLTMVLFWIFVFANRGSIAHPDEFDDPVFAQAAEAICAPRQAAIAELPLPTAASGPIDRAVTVTQATEELERMVAELGALPPPTDPKGVDGVARWLDDYEIFLNDRRDWAQLLSEGRDEIFIVSATTSTGEEDGVRVTNLLRTFAEVNRMDSCAPSPDVR